MGDRQKENWISFGGKRVSYQVCTLILALVFIFTIGCATAKSPQSTSVAGKPGANADSAAPAPPSGPQPAPQALPPDSMISASQLDEGIKTKKDWQIIDVREPHEFATGHVPAAVNIPLGNLEANLTKIAKDKDSVLVCLTGERAFNAWKILVAKGYNPARVKVLVGGMMQWKNLGNGEITESIGGC